MRLVLAIEHACPQHPLPHPLPQTDVFSYGVVMYEVFHKFMMSCAIANNGTVAEVENYALQVSEGYRPPMSRLPLCGPSACCSWQLRQLCPTSLQCYQRRYRSLLAKSSLFPLFLPACKLLSSQSLFSWAHGLAHSHGLI